MFGKTGKIGYRTVEHPAELRDCVDGNGTVTD
jgi:hypothetical protein